jgi:hypothetical protein
MANLSATSGAQRPTINPATHRAYRLEAIDLLRASRSDPGFQRPSDDDRLSFLPKGVWRWAAWCLCGLGAGRGPFVPVLPLGRES